MILHLIELGIVLFIYGGIYLGCLVADEPYKNTEWYKKEHKEQ